VARSASTVARITSARERGSIPAPPSAQLQRLAQQLKRDAGSLVETVVEVIGEIPEYRQITDPAVWKEVRQVVRANVPVFYDQVLECREATAAEFETARHYARRRVHQGIPLHAHLTAYRRGMWVFWGEVVARVIGHPSLQEELLLRTAWAFRHHEQISAAVAESYCAEQDGRTRQRHQIVRAVFDAILDGTITTAAEVTARAGSIGLDLDRDFEVFVASTPGPNVVIPVEPIGLAVAKGAAVDHDALVTVDRGCEVILLAPMRRPHHAVYGGRAKLDLAGALAEATGGLPISVGVSGPIAGVEGIRAGYREATRAIEIGRSLAPGEFVHFYESYVVHDTLETGFQAGRRLLRDTLGPLIDLGESGKHLVKTLEAYFAGGTNLKVAASFLDIHPNTLAYRIRQIRQITGIDLTHHDNRLRTEMAVRLHALELAKQPATARAPEASSPAVRRPSSRSAR
jgi:sugar diacid utilization regulator